MNKRFFHNLARVRAFLREVHIKPVNLFLPATLALGASLFEGMSFSLLAPTIRGLTTANFDFVSSVKFIGPIVKNNPDIFLNSNSSIFIFLVGWIFFSSVSKNILSYISSAMVSWQVQRFSHELRKMIFDAYIGFQKSFFDKNSTGHLQNILIGYTDQIGYQFRSFHSALYSVFSLMVYLGIILSISWKATLFLFCLFPAVIFLFQKLMNQIERDSQSFSDAFSLLGKKISNALICIPLVRASCSEGEEKRRFEHISLEVRRAQYSMDKRSLLIQPVQEIFGISMLLVLTGFMAYLIVSKKEGNISSFLVFLVIIRRAMSTLSSLTSVQGSLFSVTGPLREIMHIFENRAKYTEKTGALPFLSFKNKIEFKDLTFRYLDRDVLNNVSFELPKGQMVAVVGKTGSGKSTLAQLLMRFYDAPKGTLFVDGQDILDYQIADLRKRIAYISQEAYFFDMSIDLNLKYGCDQEPSDAEVRNALDKAQLGELIAKLPQGVKTEIGERGIRLSGGEKQRVSIARAILRNPDILILDEATSAMDSHTEALMQAAIEELISGKTSFVIAHRLSTIRKADQILVVDSGKILEKGSFAELIEKKGHFYEMCKKQMFDEEPAAE